MTTTHQIPELPSVVDQLLETISSQAVDLILTQNNPDPDAIASTAALAYLCKETLHLQPSIFYRGLIGRAENQALVRSLAQDFPVIKKWDSHAPYHAVLVDVQPGSGMLSLPENVQVAAVIDRHRIHQPVDADFVDIRPALGATSTILTEYLRLAGLEPPPHLATALFYGIKTNTLSLGRGASLPDVEAYFYLQSRINVEALAEIENVQLPAEYFSIFAGVLETTRIYDHMIINFLGEMKYPDLAAEMAEFLLRYEHARCVLCAGCYGDAYHFSIRSRSPKPRADELAVRLTEDGGAAGGRGEAAGGMIPLVDSNPEQIYADMLKKTLQFLGLPEDTPGLPLI